MNKEILSENLTQFPKKYVDRYINYLEILKNEKNKSGYLANSWFAKESDENLIAIFKKLASKELYIDGDKILLRHKGGKLIVLIGYQIYKNELLRKYPKAIIDLQIVRKDDEFHFKKENSKIFYTHNIKSAFSETEIIGAYCVIKCCRGEFLTIMSRDELDKIRSKASFDDIWREWLKQMCLKSILRRACKWHFYDITSHLDVLDNDSFDMSKSSNENKNESLERQIELFKNILNDVVPEVKEVLIDNFIKFDYSEKQQYYLKVKKAIKSGKFEEVL